jgi:hypothetical protein
MKGGERERKKEQFKSLFKLYWFYIEQHNSSSLQASSIPLDGSSRPTMLTPLEADQSTASEATAAAAHKLVSLEDATKAAA